MKDNGKMLKGVRAIHVAQWCSFPTLMKGKDSISDENSASMEMDYKDSVSCRETSS